MDINSDCPLHRLGGKNVIGIVSKKGKIVVNVQVESHPCPDIRGANCYFFDLVLFTWDRTNAAATVTRKDTDWNYLKSVYVVNDDEKFIEPEFEFDFPKPPGTIHWLLALRLKLGVDGKGDADEVYTVKAEAAKFIGAGSFDKKEQAMLDKRWKEIENEEPFKERKGRIALAVAETVKAKKGKKGETKK